MKRFSAFFILLLLAGVHSFSQKKTGTVYSEHELIDKVENLWAAFVNGDEEAYRNFFADSAYIITNGEPSDKRARNRIARGFGEFVAGFENFKVTTPKGAYADAIEYKEAGSWVQDWKVISGIHQESGIRLNLPIHTLYAFNDEGEIGMLAQYFDNDVFEEIRNSQRKIENGTVYINHPYIVAVRKANNAFLAKDFDKWAGFFTDNARFSNAAMPPGESRSLEETKEMMNEMYGPDDVKYDLEQVGYPDCVWYEKNDMWVVYSWWDLKIQKGDNSAEIPVMLAHTFDDEGKIAYQNLYASSNHFETIFE